MDAQQATQLAAQAFVAGGPAALTSEICRLLSETLEAGDADPARLAQVTAALESLVRLGQPLEPVIAVARGLCQQRDAAQQHAHQYYTRSQAAEQERKEAQAGWAQEVERLEAAAAKARLEGEAKAQAAWEKEKAALEANVARLTAERNDLRQKLHSTETKLDDSEKNLERVREQRNGLIHELSQLQRMERRPARMGSRRMSSR
ncbi:class 5 myosin [Chlorella sorokiniana]|uniref:Class 5 myosin n=1 Tax=Chlorella sorokiniana TaxID=3076 RepID=A0A2P6U084_CHLSO|nr:class 5 myosin [Chlorella sorokiniana]|eukprot:PRW59718.1 class 5 myosin [Chlorella sorokiniana]